MCIRDRYYTASLASKTCLHLFIGLSAIGQSQMIGVDSTGDSNTDASTRLSIGILGSIVLTGGLTWIGQKKFKVGATKSEANKESNSDLAIALLSMT